ncbi:MAG: hypothetical protein JWO10_2187, partial [Microbacteriaceae bacterium]|nr:hypothetical protein [Microbacteriaceae bacterium]
MDLKLTAEHLAMAEVVRDLVASWKQSGADGAARWKSFSEVGLDQALVTEDEGGLGLGLSNLLPALKALGPASDGWPWAATIVAAPVLARQLGLELEAPVGVA